MATDNKDTKKEEKKKSNLTFYINSDRIKSNSVDIEHMKKIAEAFKSIGGKTKLCGLGPNYHTQPDKFGCTGENDVWVCMVGGDATDTHQTFAGKWFKGKLKKASLIYVRVQGYGGCKKSAINTKSIQSGVNLDKWLTKQGYSYLEGSVAQIVKDIKAGKIKGAGLKNLTGDVSEKKEIKEGYSTSEPFKAYIEIQYTVNYPYNHSSKPQVKTINVDFSMEAPEAVTTDTIGNKTIYPSFNNKLSSWQNNVIRENSFNLLQFIKDAERDYSIDTSGKGVKKYYLYKVTFKAEFPPNFEKTTTGDGDNSKEVTTNNLYGDDDKASYKMNLYSIGFYKGDSLVAKNFNSAGKKVNEVITSILEGTNYFGQMEYKPYRYQDYISFKKIIENKTKPVFDFYEIEHWANNKKDIIEDGNIIGLSNISYTPIQDTLNNSIFIFKGRYDVLRDEDTLSYYYQRYCDLNRIMKYGEQTLMNSDTSNNCSNTEAYINARRNYINNYNEKKSYTITVAGVPPVRINDFVRTHMDNPLLDSGDGGLRVASIEYEYKHDTRPAIQTKLGLGKPDTKFIIEDRRKIQQQRLNNVQLDVPKNIVYNGDDDIEVFE